MIAYLKGIISELRDNNAVIDVGGVGYVFFASSNALMAMKAGELVTVYTEMVIREDSHTLYGFIDKREQGAFKLLTTVQGVGPRVGIGILSSLSVDEINLAISTGDAKLIGKANGVGPKLAARIITELKGKVEISEIRIISGVSKDIYSDFESSVSALVNLGYGRSEAVFAVDKILSSMPDIELSSLIKQALKEMDKAR